MNKRYFHFGLFKEGVRQTRLIGLIGMITILAFTALIWLGIFAEELNYGSYSSPTFYDFPVVGAVLIAQYCLFAPIMVLFLFRYLNRRESSDFYHAIPHTREALHISYFCAVEFWNLVTTLAVTALVFLMYGCTPFMVINMSTVLPYLFNMFAAQLLVTASVLFAMSITGTTFTNIVVSLLVIFVPRVLLTVMSNMIETRCVIVDIAQQYPFLDPSLNVAAGLPISVFVAISQGNEETILKCLTNPVSGLYTLILALIMLSAAFALLHFRKSETAAKSSPSRLLQAVYRITFGVVIGLIPVYLMFDSILWDNTADTGTWMALLALLMGVALFYFLFELIATKKPKNLIRAIPGLFIFLTIDAIILASSFSIGNAILNFMPTAQDVAGITISEDEENYFVSKSSQVLLTDKESKTIAIEGLQETVKLVTENRLHRGSYTVYGDYHEDEKHLLKVNFNTQGGWQHRYILIESQDYDRLVETLQNQEDYKKCFYDLPNPDKGTNIISVSNYYGSNEQPTLTPKEQRNIYDTFVKEVNAMPFEDWYAIAIESHHGYGSCIAALDVTIAEGNDSYWLCFPIGEDYFPQTTALYLEYYYADCPDAPRQVTTLLEKAAQEGILWEDYDLSVSVLHPTEYYLDIDSTQIVKVSKELLKNAKPYQVGSEDVALAVNVYIYDDSPYQPETALFGVERSLVEEYLVWELEDYVVK